MRIPIAEPDLNGKEAEYVLDAIKGEGRISSSGKYLDRFEELSRQAFGRSCALSTSNGTTALHLALLGLGIGPGDEVLVPAFTFSASVATIVHAGATPVFVDAKPDDWTLDTSQLEQKRSAKTKAVMAVDLYGMPCDYAEIEKFCKENGLFLIEDAAEAHGARYNGRTAGSFGDVSCFSFFGNKVLTTGEGGLVLTDDPELHERMRVLKNHGMKKPGSYEHEVAGYNYRLTNIQAAIGCAQLERFGEFLRRREENEQDYREKLGTVPGLRFQEFDASKKKPVCWMFSLLVEKDVPTLRRYLDERGIETRPLFKPMHLQPAYLKYPRSGEAFPVSERLHQEGLNLPSSALLTSEQRKNVIETFCAALKDL